MTEFHLKILPDGTEPGWFTTQVLSIILIAPRSMTLLLDTRHLLDTLLDTSWLRFTEDWDQQGCEQSESDEVTGCQDQNEENCTGNNYI